MTEDEIRMAMKRRFEAISMREWCRLTGCKSSHVSEFLSGKRGPPADLLAALNLEIRLYTVIPGLLASLDTLTAERDALKAAKWDVKHVDTANDMVAMGMARDDAIAERDAAVKRAEGAEDDYHRVHRERMSHFTRVIEAETRAAAAEERARALEEALRLSDAALRKHHEWHAGQTDPDPEHGFVPADEYGDSAMCDETTNALIGARNALPPAGEQAT